VGGRSILAGAAFLRWLRGLGPFLFAVIVSLAAFRVAVMVPLALRQSRRRRPSPQDIPVTVLVPAYNEAAVVGATLDSIFRSTHRPIDCVLIDDGSTDGTLDAALSWARSRDVPVVTDRAVSGSLAAIRVTNAGKAAALNAGIRLTDAEIVVIVDADTLFDPEAVSRLAAHFGDPRVVAVSGNVKVGNRRGLLTRLQAVEYVVGLNIARRAFDALNSITVVPGASGAFRRSALLAAGGYQSDTLAEDADITVTLGGRGRFIRYEDQARAYTEAPENWRALLKQRFRWSYGSLQVLWKHRKEILRSRKGATGMFGLPAMFLFEVVLPLLSPVADLMFVATLVGGVPDRVVVGYAVFTVLELLIAALAIRLDGERLSLLWVVPFQQVIYRQMIYAVIVRAVFTALHGGRVGWGKLARTGSVARG
jgi:peptidoglycan-N-acetylglucosamine deacetylase